MRRAAVLWLCAGLVACGGSSKNDGNPGGGGGGATVGVTGTNTFTAQNAIGYTTGATPVTCAIPGAPVAIPTAFLAVFVTDVQADVCSLVNAHQQKKGAGGVGIFITRVHSTGATPTVIGPGTYTIVSTNVNNLPPVDAQGNYTFAGAFASKNPAGACGAADIEAESGTITITAINGNVIAGSIDANLKATSGGGKITGTFTTTACALNTADVCASAVGDDSPNACVD